MTYTEKRLADFDKKFPSHGYNDNAENEFHSQNIKRFLTKSIAQAVAEERARVVGVIEKLQNDGLNVIIEGDYYVNFRDVENILSSLDKPLTNK